MKIYKNAVQEKGLVGALYQLDTSQKLPAIIVLSGSDGGTPGANAIPESFIEHLTGKGFIVFALAYFGVETLCDNLQNIQLEYFEAAFDWLALQPNINREKISLLGQSRGAELALILGSIFPDKFHSIIACSPSSKICGAFPYPNRPAWLYQKKPLQPYLAGLSSDNWDLHEAEDLKNCCDENIIPHHSNTLEDPFSIKDLFVARNLQEKSEDAA
ncbi:MAG: hypothetical protein FJZ57_08220, partial [Chlamydiae bacterium]|nr:hypothetical protein [Chlamydiota bacterium]